jgi:hypothetical protein
MKYAKALREFFSILFGSQLVVQLRADLEEARRQADYFRGQFERMQLLAIPRSVPQTERPDWRRTNAEGATRVGRRRTWAQIVEENTKRIQEEEAAAKNQEKSN